MRATDRLCIAVAVAMVLGSASLVPLTVDRSFLLLTALVVFALEGVSLLLRRTNQSSWLVHLAQLALLVVLVVVLGLFSGTAGGHGISQLGTLFHDAVLQVRTQVAPMSFSPGVRWLSVALVGVVTIISDLLVLTLLSPAWMLAPLLTLYLIPALALEHAMHWWVFGLVGLGYLGVLAADGINQNVAWTRNLSRDSQAQARSRGGAGRLAALVGIPALVISLMLGLLLPASGDLGIESSRPKGHGPLQMADPTIDLSKNLNTPVDRVVLTYKASQPLYLRTASLTTVDSSGWHLAPVQLTEGALPSPPGFDGAGKTVTADVQVNDLGGEYLPAAYAPQSFTADGQWRYDPDTLTLVSTRDTNRQDAIRNLSYQVTSVLNDPSASAFTLAQPGTPPDADVTSQAPKDVPAVITSLTRQVTKDANTPVLKAAAIQAWLSDPRNFTYSTTAPPGDGYEVLTNFLTKDKAGYCIHFAAAMALMSRIIGIPSRVSVGFLPGTRVGDHYEVKATDMHAWPELYFSGYGWVRFEPTSGVAAAPQWSLVDKDAKPVSSASASMGVKSATPSPRPSSAKPSASASSSAPAAAPQSSGGSGDVGRVLRWLGGALLVLLLLSVPALVRLATRRRRLGSEQHGHEGVAEAWTEVRDSVRDLGRSWPHGSPREVAVALAPMVGLEGARGLDRISLAVERSRYARELGETGDLSGDVRLVRHELLEQSTWTDRVLAAVAPRSLWHRLVSKLSGGEQGAARRAEQRRLREERSAREHDAED